MITPSGAGDVIKGYFGYKWFGGKERMLSISFVDKVIAVLSLFYLSTYSFIANNNFDYLYLSIVLFSIFFFLDVF